MEFWKLSSSAPTAAPTAPSTDHILDRWLKSRLNLLVKTVTEEMDGYHPTEACRAVAQFINELSTWYVRRSRDRFRAGASVEPLLNALNTVSKLMAPMTPFFAEALYREIGGGGESVHLASWPEFESKEIDATLLKDMETIKSLAEIGHSLRDEAEIKLRQPLGEFEITGFSSDNADELLSLLAEELNVKSARQATAIAERGGWLIKNSNGMDLALHTELTEELRREGTVRELLRQINDLRKEAKLTPADRITLALTTDEIELRSILTTEKEHLAEAARADEVTFETIESEFVRELKSEEKIIKIAIVKK
jgi:isoleucyl-tRNA synthetase